MTDKLDIAQSVLRDALSDAEVRRYRAEKELARAVQWEQAVRDRMTDFLRVKYKAEVQPNEPELSDGKPEA